jgi:hypothetical protein
MTGNVKLSVWRTPAFVEYDTPIYIAGTSRGWTDRHHVGNACAAPSPSIAPGDRR